MIKDTQENEMSKSQKTRLNEFFSKGRGSLTYQNWAAEINNSLGMNLSGEALRSRYRHYHGYTRRSIASPLPNTTPAEQVLADRKIKRLADAKKGTDKKYRVVQGEIESLETALEQALDLMNHKPVMTKIVAKPNGESGEGTLVVLASDWHTDELVPRHKVNGLNEYNPQIAERRAHRFFELLIRFLRVDRRETKIDNLLLWLGGDFITSSEMHDAPCAYEPVVATMVAQDLLISGITYILKEEPDLNIKIVGSVGNHSRIAGSAQRVNQATEQERSLEWMMYHAIQAHFRKESRITFQLDASYHSYVEVYGKTIRFNHGHLGWRYNDGLAGIHGPVWKVISQKWDKQIKADLTCFGHYHTYTPAASGRPYLANGSLIGLSPYSMNYGNEPPIQAYFIFHSKYGMVGQRALFVDK